MKKSKSDFRRGDIILVSFPFTDLSSQKLMGENNWLEAQLNLNGS